MDKAEINFCDNKLELPVFYSTEKEALIDISSLRKTLNLVTFDSGFMNTAPSQSKITYIDGDKGILRYRGYDIKDVAENCDFLSSIYLTIYGELPTTIEYEEFKGNIIKRSELPKELLDIAYAFPVGTHPMITMSALIGALSSIYKDITNPLDDSTIAESLLQVIALSTKITVLAFTRFTGKDFNDVPSTGNIAQDFLQLSFGGSFSEEHISILEKLLILHIDHEFNCSTSTVRLVGSSQANLFASLSSGVNALWGPLHGGANEKVVRMLEEIDREGYELSKYLEMAKDKSSSIRLMGFGHRVYKNFDPRALIIKEQCQEFLAKLNLDDPLLNIAQNLEKLALQDEYFIQRKLYPNVDFYSGIVYRALEIPTEMFTPLFALARIPGWIAHWVELGQDKLFKIGRPRQAYVGNPLRKINK